MDANSLIGTTWQAPRQREMLSEALQSYDYAAAIPYPTHAFSVAQWPSSKGPRPTALPYCQILVNEGAEFVFRNGTPNFSVVEDPMADLFLQRVIEDNNLGGEWISLAVAAGHQGAIAVKFSYDNEAEIPVRLSFLDIPQECRVWIDPHDINRLLMARIQYPYRDLESGDWYYYREEWTDDFYVTYKPIPAGHRTVVNPYGLEGYLMHLGDLPTWEIDSKEDNPFQIIPISVIRNRKVKGNPLGEGDCWRNFRLMDRIALTMHNEDFSNQMHSRPATVYKNARPDTEGPLLPEEPVILVNENKDGAPADAELLEPHGRAREYTHKTMEKWEKLLYDAVGLSHVDAESVTNKGSMTVQAFMMTYQRSIATSDRKRELWGRSGFAPFFKKMLLAVAQVGGRPELEEFESWMGVSVQWPPYFEETNQDKKEKTERTIDQLASGLVTEDKAIERVGHAERMSMSEIEQQKRDLGKKRVSDRRRETNKQLRDIRAKEDRYRPGNVTRLEVGSKADVSGSNNFTA